MYKSSMVVLFDTMLENEIATMLNVNGTAATTASSMAQTNADGSPVLDANGQSLSFSSVAEELRAMVTPHALHINDYDAASKEGGLDEAAI